MSVDGPVYLCEVSSPDQPERHELLVGRGESGVCLPFMSQSTTACADTGRRIRKHYWKQTAFEIYIHKFCLVAIYKSKSMCEGTNNLFGKLPLKLASSEIAAAAFRSFKRAVFLEHEVERTPPFRELSPKDSVGSSRCLIMSSTALEKVQDTVEFVVALAKVPSLTPASWAI